MTQIPVLRKDFIVDPWQVWEARAADADAFLLIAAVLGDALLRELLELGRELDMEPLVEVHTREELERAMAAGARIIGVNNRDLRTFEVRVETSLELIEAIPEDCIAVSESGLRTHEDLARLRARRIRCVSDWRASDEGCRSRRGAAGVAGSCGAMPGGMSAHGDVKVKICGVTNWTDARLAVDGGRGPTGLQFLCAQPALRHAGEGAGDRAAVAEDVAAVGVFVNETEEKMLRNRAGSWARPSAIARRRIACRGRAARRVRCP